jgi:uncharacterized membrane protein required for colicin V production
VDQTLFGGVGRAKKLLAFRREVPNLARMIVAAAAPATNGMPFNWFDIVVLVLLGFGLFRGKRNGMSRELIPLLQWVVLVLVCGLFYTKVAGLISGLLADTFWSCLVAYLALAMVVFTVFTILKQQLAEKVVKADFFKGGEYYLGMMAGFVRYACVLIFVLALLNAPVYTKAEIAAQIARDQQNFGGGDNSGFSGNYFPHLFQIQAAALKESFLGPRITDYLGELLINTGKPGAGDKQPGTNAPEPPKKQPVIKIGN